jgi:hypothetical protein
VSRRRVPWREEEEEEDDDVSFTNVGNASSTAFWNLGIQVGYGLEPETSTLGRLTRHLQRCDAGYLWLPGREWGGVPKMQFGFLGRGTWEDARWAGRTAE